MKKYCSAMDILNGQPMVSASIAASAAIDLPNWSIVGGLIRDFAWSKVLGRKVTPRDIDLIYLDDNDLSPDTDREIEQHLQKTSGLPFRVKNQARMHTFNVEEKYVSIVDAMSRFPTTVSAIGISGSRSSSPVLFSIFGYGSLFQPVFQITPHFFKNSRHDDFMAYLNRNQLSDRWPEVPVKTELQCVVRSSGKLD